MPFPPRKTFNTRLPLASLSEVAEFLHVGPLTVRRLIRSGSLPATQVGTQIRIDWVDVEAYIARKKVASIRKYQSTDLIT